MSICRWSRRKTNTDMTCVYEIWLRRPHGIGAPRNHIRSLIPMTTVLRGPNFSAARPSKLVLLAFLSTVASLSVAPINVARTTLRARHEKIRRLWYKAEGDSHNELSLTHGREEQETALRHMPPMLELMDIKEDDWKEWHYSFSRNDFTDFLPQFSSHLSCLVVGGESDEINRLPWQEEPHAQITNVMLHGERGSAGMGILSMANDDDDERETQRHTAVSLTQMVARTTASMARVGGDKSQPDYDCILDKGLMNAILSSIPPSQHTSVVALIELHALMQEASRAIREHGIYVVVTDQILPDHAKEYLTAIGETVGMMWNFDLDGISSDEKGVSVSVARKYFTGELPSFGHLPTTTANAKNVNSNRPLLQP